MTICPNCHHELKPTDWQSMSVNRDNSMTFQHICPACRVWFVRHVPPLANMAPVTGDKRQREARKASSPQ